jgi:hypothetical protein
LSGNWLEVSIFIDSKLEPFTRKSTVIFLVVKWFKRKPVSLVGLWVSVVDPKLEEKLFNVEGCKQFSLTVDHNFSWRLARNGDERLHDFRVWVRNTIPLLGVESLVHIVTAEVVLANHLDVLSL